jgi:hypothetical protein
MKSLNLCQIEELYLSGMTTKEVSVLTGIPRSTVYVRLRRSGITRDRKESQALAASKGRKTHIKTGWHHSEETKRKMSEAKKKYWEGKSKGVTLKPSGYYEITTGKNKGRSVHVVLMEQKIGRRIYSHECVHHKDGDRSNNDIENLELMTKSGHTRLHATERIIKGVSRDKKGRFK